MMLTDNSQRNQNNLTLARRRFLAFGGLACLGRLASPVRIHAAEGHDSRIGEVIVQRAEGILYLSVTQDVMLGDLLYEGFASQFGQDMVYPVAFTVRKGLLDTIDVGKPPIVRLGASKTEFKLSLQREAADESLFHGRLNAVDKSEDNLKFIYRDFEPIPVIVVVVGLVALFCLGIALLDKALKDCQERAQNTCGKSGVKHQNKKDIWCKY